MKIGILTYHRALNYGAYIQAYSLCQQIKRRFPEHTVEIVDFAYRYDIWDRQVTLGKLLLLYGWKRFLGEARLMHHFHRSLADLPKGKSIFTNNYSKAIDIISREYDFIVVGSDAVFNWNTNPIPNVYFFDTDKCKHVSYAASSHLLKYKETDERNRKYLQEALSKFLIVGTRDNETERFAKFYGATNIVHNCDPTIVLDFDFETPKLQEKMQKKDIAEGEKLVFVMLKEQELARDLKKNLPNDVKIVALRRPNKYADVFMDNLTPFEWAKIFSYGMMTVTDFFHGSILTLKNNRPVLSIDTSGYRGEYESKAKDLFCNRLFLPELFYDGHDPIIVAEKVSSILKDNYVDKINNAISREAKSFIDFCDCLEGIINET